MGYSTSSHITESSSIIHVTFTLSGGLKYDNAYGFNKLTNVRLMFHTGSLHTDYVMFSKELIIMCIRSIEVMNRCVLSSFQ